MYHIKSILELNDSHGRRASLLVFEFLTDIIDVKQDVNVILNVIVSVSLLVLGALEHGNGGTQQKYSCVIQSSHDLNSSWS